MRVVNEARGGAPPVTHLLFEDFLEAIVRVAPAKARPPTPRCVPRLHGRRCGVAELRPARGLCTSSRPLGCPACVNVARQAIASSSGPIGDQLIVRIINGPPRQPLSTLRRPLVHGRAYASPTARPRPTRARWRPSLMGAHDGEATASVVARARARGEETTSRRAGEVRVRRWHASVRNWTHPSIASSRVALGSTVLRDRRARLTSRRPASPLGGGGGPGRPARAAEHRPAAALVGVGRRQRVEEGRRLARRDDLSTARPRRGVDARASARRCANDGCRAGCAEPTRRGDEPDVASGVVRRRPPRQAARRDRRRRRRQPRHDAGARRQRAAAARTALRRRRHGRRRRRPSAPPPPPPPLQHRGRRRHASPPSASARWRAMRSCTPRHRQRRGGRAPLVVARVVEGDRRGRLGLRRAAVGGRRRGGGSAQQAAGSASAPRRRRRTAGGGGRGRRATRRPLYAEQVSTELGGGREAGGARRSLISPASILRRRALPIRTTRPISTRRRRQGRGGRRRATRAATAGRKRRASAYRRLASASTSAIADCRCKLGGARGAAQWAHLRDRRRPPRAPDAERKRCITAARTSCRWRWPANLVRPRRVRCRRQWHRDSPVKPKPVTGAAGWWRARRRFRRRARRSARRRRRSRRLLGRRHLEFVEEILTRRLGRLHGELLDGDVALAQGADALARHGLRDGGAACQLEQPLLHPRRRTFPGLRRRWRARCRGLRPARCHLCGGGRIDARLQAGGDAAARELGGAVQEEARASASMGCRGPSHRAARSPCVDGTSSKMPRCLSERLEWAADSAALSGSPPLSPSPDRRQRRPAHPAEPPRSATV